MEQETSRPRRFNLAAILGLWRTSPGFRRFAPLGAAAALLAFLLLVWPTLYRHEGDGRGGKYRLNRITRTAEKYDRRSGEWKPRKRGHGNSPATAEESRSPVAEAGDGGKRRRAPGKTWWYEEGSKPKADAQADQWWYQEDGGENRPGPKDRWWGD